MKSPDQPSACAFCGALVYPDMKQCIQCGRFPVKLHQCPKCRTIAASDEDVCPKCGRMFEPGGDYL